MEGYERRAGAYRGRAVIAKRISPFSLNMINQSYIVDPLMEVKITFEW